MLSSVPIASESVESPLHIPRERVPELSIVMVHPYPGERIGGNTGPFPKMNGETPDIWIVDVTSGYGEVTAGDREPDGVRRFSIPEGQGFSESLNIVMDLIRSPYIALMRSGTLLLDDCLDRMRGFFEENEFVGMAGPEVLTPGRIVLPSFHRWPGRWERLAFTLGLHLPPGRSMKRIPWERDTAREVRSVDALSGCFRMIRRKAFIEVGMHDETILDCLAEFDLCLKLRSNAWDVVYHPGCRVMDMRETDALSKTALNDQAWLLYCMGCWGAPESRIRRKETL